MNYKIITYYTEDTEYKEEFETRLEPSLKKFNLDYKVYPMPNLHNWTKNCQQKTKVIYNALREFKKPIVWIDVDAEVNKNPVFFDGLTCDISCYYMHTNYNPNELLSGTLYFAYNEKILQIIQEWMELNSKNNQWDQRNLQEIVEKHKDLVLKPLPVEYIKIDKFQRHQKNCKEAFITHFRASRRIGRKIH